MEGSAEEIKKNKQKRMQGAMPTLAYSVPQHILLHVTCRVGNTRHQDGVGAHSKTHFLTSVSLSEPGAPVSGVCKFLAWLCRTLGFGGLIQYTADGLWTSFYTQPRCHSQKQRCLLTGAMG